MNKILKDCPFCGGEAKLEHSTFDGSYVICTKCFIRTQNYKYVPDHASDDDAISAWNKRDEEE